MAAALAKAAATMAKSPSLRLSLRFLCIHRSQFGFGTNFQYLVSRFPGLPVRLDSPETGRTRHPEPDKVWGVHGGS